MSQQSTPKKTALAAPVTGQFICQRIEAVNIGATPTTTPGTGTDVAVTFISQDGSTLRGTVTFTTDQATADQFEVLQTYSLQAQ